MKKDFLVDVPVVVDAFIRPDKLIHVFNSIKEARPSILFIISDGPREGYPEDRAKINESRKIFENIDWDCQVHKLYFDNNVGMYGKYKYMKEFVGSKVDRFIRLEDDIVPHPSFYYFAAELLEKYKDDYRINMICGMNPLEKYEVSGNDYFFSKAESIWGFATWTRSYFYEPDYSYINNKYEHTMIKNNSKKYKAIHKKLSYYPSGKLYNGHGPGTEFRFVFNVSAYHQLNIIPSRNMINCIGYGSDSTHSDKLSRLPKRIQKLYNMKTYEIEKPIKHPKYILEDKNYEQKVHSILRPSNFIKKLSRKLSRAIRMFIYK